MPGIGVICNRNAGKHNPFCKHLDTRLTSLIGTDGSLRETTSVDEIDQIANDFLANNIDILGICGGDGSNHFTLSTFIRVYNGAPLPKVAFLCGGTHNSHAASIGIHGNPEKLLENIVRKYRNGAAFELTHRNILQVNDGTAVRYGFTLATGFMHRFMEDLVVHEGDSVAKTAGKLFSWIGSWIIHGEKIRSAFEPQPAQVTVDHQCLAWERINGVSTSAMERLGLGFAPYPRAGEKRGYFPFNVLRVSPTTFIRLMWDYKKSRIPTHPDQINDICTSLLLEAQTEVGYVLDGEIYRGSSRLEVTTGPGFDFITR
jgi:diacylglycerol kinase (ATP)